MVVESILTLFLFPCCLVFNFRLGVGSDIPASSVTRNSLIGLNSTAERYRNALNKAVN
jgi:hypothetical protein